MSAPRFDPAIDALLVKYLLGEATAAEREQVTGWCALDAANRRYFDHFRLLWDASRAQAPAEPVDEMAAWERFQARRAEPAMSPVRSIRRHRSPLLWVAAAAVIALTATAIWGYLNRTLTLQSNAIALTQTLPDGSQVTLNKHSSLKYTARFDRSVTLDGEGFFDIRQNPAQPFLVKVGAATVQVLGTSFNIRQGDSATIVTVETGRVAIRVGGDRQQEIGAGQEVRITAGGATIRTTTDQLYQYYRTRVFACHATPLGRLAQVLSEAYDTPIRIDTPGAADLPLTATFRDESLDQVLDVATKTLGLSWSRQGQEVVIR
ncbi:MAG TPA: FecR domain-containing protein [Dinghuibacter sp.]|uniref:FecR family protein n=1 Tax=Dinghuibacter sp. TaxID=2024697 RepID=UPI002C01AE60|nr:FecR domain-containing protein [Dinghuibacter sp.]HTJ13180.1 FecR domain-containing protein [Dinghuibacter sp.]